MHRADAGSANGTKRGCGLATRRNHEPGSLVPNIAQLGRPGQPLLSRRRVIVQGVSPVVINNVSLLFIPLSNAKCDMRLSGAQLQ